MFFKDPSYYLFVLKLAIVFLAGGIIMAGMFQRLLNRTNSISSSLIILLGIGFSPFWISLVLYFSFLLLPGQSDVIYLFLIYGGFLAMGVYAKKQIAILLNCIRTQIGIIFKKHPFIFTLGIFSVLFVFTGWSYYITSKKLTEHDVLEYAVQGKIFYETKLISYSAHRIDAVSGFYYVGLHGFSFPLQATNERLLNTMLQTNTDLLFRSLNSIYGLLILFGLFVFGLKRNGKWFSLIFALGLLMSYGFFETIMKYHIDNFRIFFFLAAIFLAFSYLKNNDFKLLLFTAVFLGAQANAHSLGCLLAIVIIGVLFLFSVTPFLIRIKHFALFSIVFLIGGAFHYLLDVYMGTGWIFQEVKFY